MAFVYWIHLPEHTDIFTEGYVGFTKLTPHERFKTHKYNLTTKRSTPSTIRNALIKYKDC